MGAFEYTALDTRGKQRKGVLEGDTPRHVRQQLRDQGLVPLEIGEVAQQEKTAGSSSFRLRRGISATDLALIIRQLATLIRSALPLEEAIFAVAQQTDKPRLKNMLLAVRARVMEGHTLAHGLGEFPHIFPEIFRATVAAGEQSGHLDAVLERLADYAENRQQVQQRLQLALIYPVLLTVMALAIVSLLLVYVVPKVVVVFQDTGQTLPFITRALIGTSDFIRTNGLLLLIAILATSIGTRWWLAKPGPRRRYHTLLLKLPLIGKITRGMNTARFARTLAILGGAGVPVLEALRIAGEVITNIPMREAVAEAAARIREGAPIARALGASKLFPPMMIHLIASGEASGKLDEMLERAAGNQEREMTTLISTMLGIMEPVLILIMGIMVLIIVLAILLPIFEMNQFVG